ncbi:MAG: flippase [Chloroflexi bacterium]|nr:flippase [Chloroflexota bacterium]
MSLATNALVTLSARLVNLVFAMVASILLARFLGPENRGVYALLVLVVSMASFLGNMGLGTANVYFLSKGRLLASVLWNSLLASSLLGAILVLLTVPFLGIISNFAGGSVAVWLVLAILATTPLRIASLYVNNLFLGIGKIGTYNVVSIFNSAFSLAPLLVLLYVFQDDLTAALLAFIAGSAISPLVPCAWIWVRRYSPMRPSLDWGLLKESLRFGIKGHLGNIAGFLNYRMDMFLVAYFVGASGVGLYTIAVGIAEMVGILPSAVAMVLLPRVASSGGKGGWEYASISCRNVVLLTVLATLLLLPLGRPVIHLAYGSEFSPSYPALIALLPAMIALGIDQVISSYITGSGRPILATYAIAVATMVNLGLNLVFIPLWGITGAAAASSVSYSVSAGIVVLYSLKISKGRLLDVILPRPSDITIYRLVAKSLLRR